MLHADVMAEQLREWATMIENNDDVNGVIAGMRCVADDIDPASHPEGWPREPDSD